MNRRLKARAMEQGVDSCEIKLPGCLRGWALSWAHSKKSRFLITDEDWMEAALACCECHKQVENMNHESMHRLVTEALGRRLSTVANVSGKKCVDLKQTRE
jgi:hypothetical protein